MPCWIIKLIEKQGYRVTEEWHQPTEPDISKVFHLIRTENTFFLVNMEHLPDKPYPE